MAGDTNNPRVWLGADVYVAPAETAGPATLVAAWPPEWDALGLLSEDGMEESAEEEETDHNAWGVGLVRKTNQNWMPSFTVTALEDNPVCFQLRYPGSTQETAGGVTTRQIVSPSKHRVDVAIGLELVDGDITRRRIVPKCHVRQDGSVSIGPDAMEMFMFQMSPLALFDAGLDDFAFWTDLSDNPAAVVVGS